MDQVLHDALQQAGKAVRMDVYEHGYHDFVLGPQGQKRPDLPKGEILLRGRARRARAVGRVREGGGARYEVAQARRGARACSPAALPSGKPK